MPITIDTQNSTVTLGVKIVKFNDLASNFRLNWANTGNFEEIGKNYVSRGFLPDETEGFAESVCKWAGKTGGRVIGNLKKHHAGNWADVAAIFKQSYEYTLSPQEHRKAISAITKIKGLDVSFGSKHLKFLNPNNAVVLDEIIDRKLGYRRNQDGYAQFISDCYELLRQLKAKHVRKFASIAGVSGVAPTFNSEWRVCDVEMAIFASLGSRSRKSSCRG